MNMMNVGRAKWVCLGLVVWMLWIGGGAGGDKTVARN